MTFTLLFVIKPGMFAVDLSIYKDVSTTVYCALYNKILILLFSGLGDGNSS